MIHCHKCKCKAIRKALYYNIRNSVTSLTVIKTGQIIHQHTRKKILGAFPVISVKLLDRRFTPDQIKHKVNWEITLYLQH